MKKLENKVTELTDIKDDKEVKMGYMDLLLIGLNSAPKDGWTVAQMKERFNVIEKIGKVKIGSTVSLEDAEFQVAYDCRIINWAMMHKDIIAFEEYLEKKLNE